MAKKKYWYGKEIEGRLYGIETLFIPDDFKGFKKIIKKFNHVLVGPKLIEKMNSGTSKISWSYLEKQMDERHMMLTIEVKPELIKMLPQAIKLKAHILLWIDCPELAELKETDSVKICNQSHEMYVFTLFNGQKVTRKDYQHDRYDR
jgi:hypothetical protein